MDSHSVLVFPAGMPASLAWARHASESGLRVVGASSLAHDPAQPNFAEWAFLPWIGDADFPNALKQCVREKRIDAVFTSHPVVWNMLRELLPRVSPKIRLEAQPWAAELADYREYREIAMRFHQDPLQLAASGDPAPPMPLLELAALVRQFQLVPGQCDYAKLEAMIAIFRWMPPGDVVEIGSLWGRSAIALAILARYYRIGNLLCVDPWRTDALGQGIAELDAVAAELPMEDIFGAFRMNLAPYKGFVNYSRTRSSDAASRYSAGHSFTTEEFGQTAYSGEIALLHLDGNHALEAVRRDIAQWRRFVRPDGWIVFDDYRWPFGDGPKTAADEFCNRFCGTLTSGFVAGGALLVRVAG